MHADPTEPRDVIQTATHWQRGLRAYGQPGDYIVVQMWWPINDPRPEGRLW